MCKQKIYLIAGTPLELYEPQHGHEIQASVMVQKSYRLGNQQPRSEKDKVQRLSRKGVEQQAVGCSKR